MLTFSLSLHDEVLCKFSMQSLENFFHELYSKTALFSTILQTATSETTADSTDSTTVSMETAETSEAIEGEGQTEEVPTGEVESSNNEVQAAEVDTSGLEAPVGSEEPTSSEVPVGEVSAEGTLQGRFKLCIHTVILTFMTD